MNISVAPGPKAMVDAHSEENRRSEKRLARGLEDILNLFLSDPSDRPPEAADSAGTLPKPVPSKPILPTISIVRRSSDAIHRDEVISMLRDNTAVLEEGLRVVDAAVPCHPFGPIDLVALDKSGRLVILLVDTVKNNESLLRGIACFDWIARNVSIVRRMYRECRIDFSAPPRLFLVAPGFSPLLQCVSQRSAIPKVCCFVYRTVQIPEGTGILFERS